MYVVTQRGGKDARYGDLVAQERGTATSWLRSVAGRGSSGEAVSAIPNAYGHKSMGWVKKAAPRPGPTSLM